MILAWWRVWLLNGIRNQFHQKEQRTSTRTLHWEDKSLCSSETVRLKRKLKVRIVQRSNGSQGIINQLNISVNMCNMSLVIPVTLDKLRFRHLQIVQTMLIIFDWNSSLVILRHCQAKDAGYMIDIYHDKLISWGCSTFDRTTNMIADQFQLDKK